MYNANNNEFFRQATSHILGSLDINEALKRCYLFFSQALPCEDMFFVQYDRELNAFPVVAKYQKYPQGMGDINIMPSQSKKLWLYLWEKEKEVYIINRPEEIPEFRDSSKSLNFTLNQSFISLKLRTGGQKIGFFVISARGTNRYNPTHLGLVYMLKDPLTICMANALKHQELVRLKDILNDNNQFLQCELNDRSGTEIIGAHGGLRSVMEMVRQISQLDSPILLEGETGVGKGLVAHTIHRMSKRNEGPFISVNCGAIPESLVDSELFGHEKGAFTGAVEKKRGRFERAEKGTIFLDEVGELPHQVQVRLLHVLQNKEIERVGGSQTIPVDIRIISATNRNLEKMVNDGTFREDLWYRLNVFPIHIPPLRQRKEDIPALTHYFIKRKSVELNKPEQPTLAPGTIKRLMSHQWPGNIRELQNIVERALIQHTQGPLRFSDLALWPEEKHEETQYTDARNQLLPLETMTAIHIRRALVIADGKISGPGGAAELLAINPNTLRKKMDRLKIPYKKRRTGRNRSTPIHRAYELA